MKHHFIFIILIASSAALPRSNHLHQRNFKHVSPKVFDAGYRLPTNVFPTHYQLDLLLEEDAFETNSFSGVASITIKVLEPTDSINFHAKDLEITTVELRRGDSLLDVSWDETDSITDIVTLLTDQVLDEDVYLLTITYTGIFSNNEMNGFYISFYTSENTIHYVASSDFEATNARKAFPCFDEPAFKASFDISITKPQIYNALSNTRITSVDQVENTNLTKTTFGTTPIMSTYLIAFIVSEYTCTSGEEVDGAPTQVCSPPETTNLRQAAVDATSKILRVMESYTGLSYSSSYIGQLTQVSIPNYLAGAMENWGLATYRETLLLWDNEESSNRYEQDVITVVFHELSHQWFGDLVTLDWWSDVFLNEGFATYFEYYGTAEIRPDWEVQKQFVVEQLQVALESDSFDWALPLSSYVETPSDIDGRFDDISYDKGGSILVMLQHFLGLEAFKSGLTSYIEENKFSIGEPQKLWQAFQPFAQDLPADMVEIMDNWTYKSGYPLLTVTVDGDDVIISQEQFLLSGSSDTRWYVPVTYSLSGEDPLNTETRGWLTPTEDLRLTGVLANSTWIVLNNQQIGYYRVNYDDSLWKEILNSIQEISSINRAQISDDLFNLARAGRKNLSEVLDKLSFLESETEYYPWYSSFYIFSYLLTRVGDVDVLQAIKERVSQLMSELYSSTPFDDERPDDHIYTLKKSMALSWACSLENKDCVSNSLDAFIDYRDNSISPSRNLKDVIYCYGLRYSTMQDQDFDLLWFRYLYSQNPSEKETILSSLGCATDRDILNLYLQEIITGSLVKTQDIYTAYRSVYSSSPQGLDAAFNFAIKNYQEIVDHFGGVDELNWLIYVVADRFTSQEQVDKLRSFTETVDLDDEIRDSALDALENAEDNLVLTQQLEDELRNYFNIK